MVDRVGADDGKDAGGTVFASQGVSSAVDDVIVEV